MNYIGALHVVKFVTDRQKGRLLKKDRIAQDRMPGRIRDRIALISDNPLLLRFIGTNNFSLRNL
jgi:hypothetical protein